MTTKQRRRLGRTIRTARRRGYTKRDVLVMRDDYEQVWDCLRSIAAPAIQFILACMANDRAPHPSIIHNGRKPR